MSVAESLRVGWCPGALRPMRVGDGLLVRVKPRANRLTIAQARAVAEAAARFGNGVLNITGRANLQIRGVDDRGLPALTEVLRAEDLLDASPAAEAVRNVLYSPLAGRDPDALFDIRHDVAALEDALARDPLFQALPAKFNWSVEDGGSLSLADVPSDVRFCAARGPEGAAFHIHLAGASVVGTCGSGDLVAAAAALAGGFLSLCDGRGLSPHRMRDLVAALGAETVFSAAGLPVAAAGQPQRGTGPVIGARRMGTSSVMGAAPAFGRLEAGLLDRFAAAAGLAGAPDIGLTPWRSLLVAGLASGEADTLLRTAAALGLITDPADPRLAVAACAGEPACARAAAPVQDHAAAWARLLAPASGARPILHVSGCPKGCAHAGPAPLTLVAQAHGYDLVRNGRADDAPAIAGLSLEAVAAMVAAKQTMSGETLS